MILWNLSRLYVIQNVKSSDSFSNVLFITCPYFNIIHLFDLTASNQNKTNNDSYFLGVSVEANKIKRCLIPQNKKSQNELEYIIQLIFKIMKKIKKLSPWISKFSYIFFKNAGEINTFLNTQRQKEFITRKYVLQKLLKVDVLHRKN